MATNQTKGHRRLRDHFRLMEPDELTPEERWERVVELLALACLAPAAQPPDQPPDTKAGSPG